MEGVRPFASREQRIEAVKMQLRWFVLMVRELEKDLIYLETGCLP